MLDELHMNYLLKTCISSMQTVKLPGEGNHQMCEGQPL